MDDQALQRDEMQEIIEEFIAESSELMDHVIQDIVTIEQSQDEEMINGIFRAVHTIKGTSSFLGFNTLSELAHKARRCSRIGPERRNDNRSGNGRYSPRVL